MTSSKPEIPSHTRCDSPPLNILIRWKSPETITSTPISTAMTFSEPLGWKATISPSINVTMPATSVACHVATAAKAGGSAVLVRPFPYEHLPELSRP